MNVQRSEEVAKSFETIRWLLIYSTSIGQLFWTLPPTIHVRWEWKLVQLARVVISKMLGYRMAHSREEVRKLLQNVPDKSIVKVKTCTCDDASLWLMLMIGCHQANKQIGDRLSINSVGQTRIRRHRIFVEATTLTSARKQPQQVASLLASLSLNPSRVQTLDKPAGPQVVEDLISRRLVRLMSRILGVRTARHSSWEENSTISCNILGARQGGSV